MKNTIALLVGRILCWASVSPKTRYALLAGFFLAITISAVMLSSLWFAIASRPNTYSVKLAQYPSFQAGSNFVGITEFDALVREYDSQVLDIYLDHNQGSFLGGWVSISDDNDALLPHLKALQSDGIVLEIVPAGTMSLPHVEYRLATEEDRSVQSKDWNLSKIRAGEALDMLDKLASSRLQTYGANSDSEIVVAIIDTGIDLDHTALKGRLVQGRNIVNNNDDPKNKNKNEKHGTHVCSSVVMSPEFSEPAFGVAHTISKCMPVRVLNERGTGTHQNISKGIVWAADNGADVINLSLGGPSGNALLRDAIIYATQARDVLIVSAKGNSNTSRTFYPADYPEVLAIAATNVRDERAFFSNFGGRNNPSSGSCPGEEIFGAFPGGESGYASGTSMASPHCSAGGAIIRFANPSLNQNEVRAIIESQGVDVNSKQQIGLRMDAVNYLEAALSVSRW